MKCDICGVNDADVFIQEVNHITSIEKHYCRECAKKAGINIQESRISLSDAMQKLFDHSNKVSNIKIICDFCHVPLPVIKKTGRVGCPNCYRTFKTEVLQLAKKTHSKIRITKSSIEETSDIEKLHFYDKLSITENVEKKNSENLFPAEELEKNATKELEDLQQKLSDAVAAEDYETAVIYRDKIALMSKPSPEGEC